METQRPGALINDRIMEKKKSKIHVLVVEDDYYLNALLTIRIKDLGYVADSAYDGQQAFEMLREKPYDLMLIDYKLPDTTAAEWIEKAGTTLTLPPFIVITAYGDEKIAVSMMKKGAYDYWVKEGAFMDAFPDKFKNAVSQILNERKLREARQKLRTVEEQSRKVLEAMADPVIVVNKDMKIVFHNRAFSNVFGLSRLRSPCHKVIYNRASPCPWCAEIKEGEKEFINVCLLVEKNKHFFQPAVGAVRFNGRNGYRIIILRDITDSVVARRKAEKNETLLRNLIATIPEAIVGINAGGRIVMYNRAALDLFEEKAENFKKKDFFSLLSTDKYLLRIKRLFTGVCSDVKNPLINKIFRLTAETPRGMNKYVQSSLSVNDFNGEKLYLFVLRDISEKHKRDKELLEQKLLIRSVVDNLPDHIYYKDKKLRFLLSNKAHNHHVGVASEEELVGKTDRDFYPEELARKYAEDEMRVIHSGLSELNIKEKTLDREGKVRWQLSSKIPVKDGLGNVIGLVGIGRDITDLELKDREINKSKRRLESLLEITLSKELDRKEILNLAMEKAIELTESKIGYLYFFDEEKKMFTLHNWSDTVLQQCNIADKRTVFPLDKAGIWGEAVRQRRPIMINDYNQDNPLKKDLPKGHVPILRFLTLPVFYQKQIVAVIGVANKENPYDRSDLIQLELLMATVWEIIVQKEQQSELIKARRKAEESEKLKTVFMSTMSHELRTPLNAILGFSRLLDQTADPEEVKEYSRYISESGERLLTIIENIFYVSAIDGQYQKIEKGEIHPEKLVSDIVGQFKQTGIPDSIKIETLLPVDPGIEAIISDAGKTEQILRALIDNALKFTPSGKVTVGYHLEETKIRYFVKDTGIGIPEDKRELIFEKFKKLDEANIRVYGGIGIGLYLARRLTEIMKGSIRVEDNKPQGSIFTVELPVTVKFKSKAGLEQSKSEALQKDVKTRTVLIAEDDPVSAMLLKKILTDLGVKPVHVENGLEAVKYVEGGNPCDMILMDLNMPVMDGFEAIEKIKGIREDIPIVIQTAYDSETGRAKARDLKVEDFISKPVKREQLTEKVIQYTFPPVQ